MSRAERKLAELKAKEELKQLKIEKRQRQQQDLGKSKQQWQALPRGAKTVVVAVFVGIIVLLVIAVLASANSVNTQNNTPSSGSAQVTDTQQEPTPKTAQETMLDSISGLIKSGDAFDSGSYIKGEVPEGDYVFMPFKGSGQYYSEEDSAGNIIDNEIFDSFGYVYVHSAGNLETKGVLIKVGALEKLGAKSAKEVYEKLNNVSDYKESAWYKVGMDIAPGTYTIESYGESYVAVMSGPVGNSEIVDNEIFNDKHSVNVAAGQYLKISKGKISE